VALILRVSFFLQDSDTVAEILVLQRETELNEQVVKLDLVLAVVLEHCYRGFIGRG